MIIAAYGKDVEEIYKAVVARGGMDTASLFMSYA
jgi:hypothetical protein